MRTIFVGGYFEKNMEPEIIKDSKGAVENSANVFQKKLIEGFRKTCKSFFVISAPLIGAYPQRYKKHRFKAPELSFEKDVEYVSFNNIWGYRNISRRHSLIKKAKSVIDFNDELFVVVYCPHSPFLEVAKYIKKRCKNAKICLIVPDLPQFMMLSEKKPLYYRILKYFDVKHINKLCQFVDEYVVLTDNMLDILPAGREKKGMVVEGIIAEKVDVLTDKRTNEKKKILYAGKLQTCFGVMRLLEAFLSLEREDVQLAICGDGENKEKISKIADGERIVFKGQVSAHEAKRLIAEADVLVNPRQNDMEYTKYSFPSKNIEYLASGNAVVAYMLDGMSDEYENFLYVPEDNSVEALAEALESALDDSEENVAMRRQHTAQYMNENLYAEKVCKRILEMNM